jgi:hypothetical protein
VPSGRENCHIGARCVADVGHGAHRAASVSVGSVTWLVATTRAFPAPKRRKTKKENKEKGKKIKKSHGEEKEKNKIISIFLCLFIDHIFKMFLSFFFLFSPSVSNRGFQTQCQITAQCREL